jgi:hydroxypyruvate isomerase
MIPLVANAGFKNLICFSGNKRNKTNERRTKQLCCGLNWFPCRKTWCSFSHGLNSKINHPDYQCNSTPWGVVLAKRLNSDHFKLLYDIYHIQIDEGDIIGT